MRLSWSQPCCEACWIDRCIERSEAGRVPARIGAKVERCSFCGITTMSGIYVRQDPTTVLYPAMDEGDE